MDRHRAGAQLGDHDLGPRRLREKVGFHPGDELVESDRLWQDMISTRIEHLDHAFRVLAGAVIGVDGGVEVSGFTAETSGPGRSPFS